MPHFWQNVVSATFWRVAFEGPASCDVGNRRGVVAFLPKNTDLEQLAVLAPEGRQLEVERQVLDGFLKGIIVYFWS